MAGDDLVINCVLEGITEPVVATGFIFDGSPRTLGQARALDETLEKMGLELDAVLELMVVEAVLLDRIIYRAREVKAAGQPVRTDDNLEALKVRLEVYRAQTKPLADYYRTAGLLRAVDGLGPVDQVTRTYLRNCGSNREHPVAGSLRVAGVFEIFSDPIPGSIFLDRRGVDIRFDPRGSYGAHRRPSLHVSPACRDL
ncbi:hypothetical protein F4V91_31430 [Neorhizobium galegae]|uniref:Adenylate kinase n=1 Tax=Neorhizobium galegae TaxID=399 RepID=A0A6A1TKX4_NEOGA|nr:hypothetical protein F4V91_31430 [Neorhizobium galegae]